MATDSCGSQLAQNDLDMVINDREIPHDCPLPLKDNLFRLAYMAVKFFLCYDLVRRWWEFTAMEECCAAEMTYKIY